MPAPQRIFRRSPRAHAGGAGYWTCPCDHGLCNVDHQRELQAVLELDAQPWAGAMRDFLLTAEKAVLSALAVGQD